MKTADGNIIVSGHTDNIPISTSRFPSNWELSAARSAAVVHHLVSKENIDANRLQIRAHAETKPLFTNYTEESRGKNRRVEISILGNKKLFYEFEDINTVVNSENSDN